MARRARAAVARLLRRWADLLDPRPVDVGTALEFALLRLRTRQTRLALVGDRLRGEVAELGRMEPAAVALDLALMTLHLVGAAEDAVEGLAEHVEREP